MRSVIFWIFVTVISINSVAFAGDEVGSSVRKNPDGIVMITPSGTLRLQVWSDRIIRVTFAPGTALPTNQSLSVIGNPAKTKWTLHQTPDDVTVETKTIRARANRQTGVVSFYDGNGQIILREKSRNVAVTDVSGDKARVQQTFDSPLDEHIYGLGQHQKGAWNYRGSIVRLLQENMEVAVPVLVSTKGYGVLWDNPSVTEVAVATGTAESVPAAHLFATNGLSGGLTGTYFTGTNFDAYVGTRKDATVDFDWASGPLPGLSHDEYSVRWEGSLQAGVAGEYALEVTSDDGVRLWVDGKLAVDAWNVHPAQTDVANLRFAANSQHSIRLEYFQNLHDARIRFAWRRPATDATVAWTSEAGKAVDYYFMFGPSADNVIQNYRKLTGDAPLMPKWLWGFWQCKERYQSQMEIIGVVAEYRKRGVPIDGIIQDWQYWKPGRWGSHEFDPARYADPAGMVKTLHEMNTHVLISVWPKFDQGLTNLSELEQAGGIYSMVVPSVYPKGQQLWYDAFNPTGRRIYWGQMSKQLFSLGFDGWWLDASEPELSGKWGEFRNLETAAGSGAKVLNAYPLLHTTGVAQGQRAESDAKRVCILTRSGYAGQQRNSAITWSGDIKGTWDVFAKQIPAGLNFCVSGIPYWNTDIGGFFSKKPSDKNYQELFTRWFQFGAFNPMFRVHGTGASKELWRWDEPTQAILEKYIRLRYRMLPYIYSVSWQVTSKGGTMMRPLMMDFADDSRALDVSDQFLFGPAVMVSPVTEAGATNRAVYLPGTNVWYDFWTGKREAGGNNIKAAAPIEIVPLYVPAGTMLPLGPVVQHVAEKPADPTELRIFRGADGAFTLYEDEGDNYNYERGVFATIPFTWNEAKQLLRIGARKGKYPGMLMERTFRIVFVSEGHGNGIEATANADTVVKYDGKAIEVMTKNE
jgi:alpha-D-xyloside xylohydrolase